MCEISNLSEIKITDDLSSIITFCLFAVIICTSVCCDRDAKPKGANFQITLLTCALGLLIIIRYHMVAALVLASVAVIVYSVWRRTLVVVVGYGRSTSGGEVEACPWTSPASTWTLGCWAVEWRCLGTRTETRIRGIRCWVTWLHFRDTCESDGSPCLKSLVIDVGGVGEHDDNEPDINQNKDNCKEGYDGEGGNGSLARNPVVDEYVPIVIE